MQRWLVALLILGIAVALLNPLRSLAMDRYARTQSVAPLVALLPAASPPSSALGG